MPSITPTPLPIVSTAVEDEKARQSLQNILIYLQRTRRVLFDSSVEESLGAQLAGLTARPKDIYTFPIGTPVTTPSDPGYAAFPLDAVADGRVLACKARGQTPATGAIEIQVRVDGQVLTTLAVSAGQTRVVTLFSDPPAITADQQVAIVVMNAPADPGFADAVVQVLVT